MPESPSELLAERISDKEPSRKPVTKELDAAFAILVIALRVIRSASAAGNVQCIAAQAEMEPFLKIILN